MLLELASDPDPSSRFLLLWASGLPGFPLFPYTTLFRSCTPLSVAVWPTGLLRVAPLKLSVLVPLRLSPAWGLKIPPRSEEHTSELQSRRDLIFWPVLEKIVPPVKLTLGMMTEILNVTRP